MGNYEIVRKSKIGEYMQTGVEFFICDMDKKKVYNSNDLRIKEITDKVKSENTFVFKAVDQM